MPHRKFKKIGKERNASQEVQEDREGKNASQEVQEDGEGKEGHHRKIGKIRTERIHGNAGGGTRRRVACSKA
jgi:hypothetical protein